MACPRCGLLGRDSLCPACRQITSDQRRALSRLNASIRAKNREIERGNRRRRECLVRVLEWCMRGDETRARIWVAKLVAAGFNPDDGAELERMDLRTLEAECRRLLGVRPRQEAI